MSFLVRLAPAPVGTKTTIATTTNPIINMNISLIISTSLLIHEYWRTIVSFTVNITINFPCCIVTLHNGTTGGQTTIKEKALMFSELLMIQIVIIVVAVSLMVGAKSHLSLMSISSSGNKHMSTLLLLFNYRHRSIFCHSNSVKIQQ